MLSTHLCHEGTCSIKRATTRLPSLRNVHPLRLATTTEKDEKPRRISASRKVHRMGVFWGFIPEAHRVRFWGGLGPPYVPLLKQQKRGSGAGGSKMGPPGPPL
jgi:hypothetical protein